MINKQKNSLQLSEEDFGERLDSVLTSYYPNISRNKLQSLIKSGDVLVNDNKVKNGYILKEEDIVTVEAFDFTVQVLDNLEKVNLDLEILYEDEDLLVVNKPKDLVVHPAASYDGVTLVNGLLYQVDKLSTINGTSRPGIVHRLDKDTSGLMIVAKSDEAHKQLVIDFSNHVVERKYYALVYGTFNETTGTINMPIKRDPNNRIKMAVVADGKPAISHFKVLEEYLNYSLLEVELETGRTHQIRVHLSEIKHPILGDDVYGPRKVYGDIGQYLHSFKVSFMHPIKKEQMSFETGLPSYFKETIKDLI